MQCMEFYDAQYDICPYCGYEENSGKKELLHIDAGTVLIDRYLIGNAWLWRLWRNVHRV